MAVQSKTLIGDVGSAVLAESVSQLNRAAGYVSSPIAHTLVAGTQTFVLCKFTEDVYVTAVEFGFGDKAAALIDNAADGFTLVTGSTPDGLGGATVCAAVDFTVPFATTDVWATMTDLQGVSATDTGSDAPFAVNAGDSLALQVVLAAGVRPLTAAPAQTLESVNVTYRPVKDSLTVDPSYTRTMQNFKSSAR